MWHEKLALHVINTNIIKAHFKVGILTEKHHFITNAKEKGGDFMGFFSSFGGDFNCFVIVPNHGAFDLNHSNKKLSHG